MPDRIVATSETTSPKRKPVPQGRRGIHATAGGSLKAVSLGDGLLRKFLYAPATAGRLTRNGEIFPVQQSLLLTTYSPSYMLFIGHKCFLNEKNGFFQSGAVYRDKEIHLIVPALEIHSVIVVQ